MTRPLPHGIKRIRRYKSCARCRDAKGKCTGLDEDYLRALDDPNYVHPSPDLPKCTRCRRLGAECTFNPSRRKGRPRRILRNQKQFSATPSQSRSPSVSQSPRPSSSRRTSQTPSPTPSDYDSLSPPPSSPVFASSRFDYSNGNGRSSPDFTLPTPSEGEGDSPQGLSPPTDVYLLPPIDHDEHELPPIVPKPPRALLPPQGINLEWIADSYLQEIFVFCPLLPPEPTKLGYHLATCDPLLLASINCLLDPSLPPPPFPSSAARISLSTFQASVFFALQAYGVRDHPRCIGIVSWAAAQLRHLGWEGDDVSNLSPAIEPKEVPAFIACGWVLWGLTIRIGVLTGKRDLLLTVVELPNEITPQNMGHHSLAILRDSTDFDHYQALCPEDREAYSEWIIGRSERVYKFAVDYLDLTTPAYNPSPDFDLESVVIAAARENAFITAIVAASSIILLLSHDSPHSRVLSPILSCSLFNSSPPASAISALARASKQVLSVVRTTRNRFGSLLAFEPHCPCFGSSLLVAAFGLLVKAEASLVEAEQDEARLEAAFDAKPLEEDLNFCEQVLERQSKWPQAEMLRAELALMRSTSLFVEPPSQ